MKSNLQAEYAHLVNVYTIKNTLNTDIL